PLCARAAPAPLLEPPGPPGLAFGQDDQGGEVGAGPGGQVGGGADGLPRQAEPGAVHRPVEAAGGAQHVEQLGQVAAALVTDDRVVGGEGAGGALGPGGEGQQGEGVPALDPGGGGG